MAGSTKILTVSYGTFSCTLEGFDDSFHSMKAIAEYFRDLAQDDRYFGAEPPAPDAEMLARIAEREISRRVEAKMDGKGIRLRADIGDDAPRKTAATASVAMPPKAAAPAAAESPSSLMPAASLIHADTPEEVRAAAPVELSQAAPTHPDAESVAAKLQRIRAVVGKSAAPAEDSFEDSMAVEDAVQTPPIEEIVKVTAEDIIGEDTSDEDAQAAAEAQAAADAAEAEAKAQAEAQAAADAAEAEAKAQAEAQAAADAAEAEAKAQADAQAAADAEAKAAADVDLSHDLNDIDIPATETTETSEAPKPHVRARIVRLRKDKPAEVVAAPVDENGDEDVAQRVAAALKVDETPAIEDAPIANDVAETPTAQDTEQAEKPSKTDAIRAAVAAAIPAGNLSDDDEDDLQRELAAVAEDIVTIEEKAPEVTEIVIEDVVEAVPEMPEVVEAPVRAGRGVLPEPDSSVSRILNQTDEALNEPTGSRRRNAIAQLKAAVAATEAARQLGDQSGTESEKQEAFRDDLDQVVRPRRPATPDEQSLRTERPRAAPLKLVASQRVDDDAPETVEGVQPRRVASAPVDATDVGGFAQFAAQMGATELPDLLEAAAAYTSFVEGVEDFSRPQIMKKVQLTTDEEFSREDGLRSFGTLLRQGRISKVRNGRFQVSEQTRFRPDARSA